MYNIVYTTIIISDVQFASLNQMYPEFVFRKIKLYVALFSIQKKKNCSFILVQVFIMIRTKPPHFSHLAHHMEGVVLVHTKYQQVRRPLVQLNGLVINKTKPIIAIFYSLTSWKMLNAAISGRH